MALKKLTLDDIGRLPCPAEPKPLGWGGHGVSFHAEYVITRIDENAGRVYVTAVPLKRMPNNVDIDAIL